MEGRNLAIELTTDQDDIRLPVIQSGHLDPDPSVKVERSSENPPNDLFEGSLRFREAFCRSYLLMCLCSFLAGSDSNVLRREVEEERAKSSRLERQVEFLEGALDHERQRNERSEAVSLPWLQLLVLKHSRVGEYFILAGTGLLSTRYRVERSPGYQVGLPFDWRSAKRTSCWSLAV